MGSRYASTSDYEREKRSRQEGDLQSAHVDREVGDTISRKMDGSSMDGWKRKNRRDDPLALDNKSDERIAISSETQSVSNVHASDDYV